MLAEANGGHFEKWPPSIHAQLDFRQTSWLW